jgi:hypothetical protein
MLALRMRPVVLAALGAVLSLPAGCKRDRGPKDPSPPQLPAIRVANSFLHCVEAGKAQCVSAEQASTGWNAMFLLSWLGSGSPVAILESLPGELASHGNRRVIESRLVGEVERYATALRGAQCDADRAEPFEPLVEAAARTASERLERLGMLRGGMQAVIERLSEDARRELQDGHLIHMKCTHDPHNVYVAVRGESGGRPAVIGMTVMWPERLGGEAIAREAVAERLQSHGLGLSATVAPIDDNSIDVWLPFRVEDL